MIPPPPPVELPDNVVAAVSNVRGATESITRAEFHRTLAQAAAGAGRRSAPKPGGKGYEKLKARALGELLDTVWIQGQAAEMGIGVTRRQLKRELRLIKREAFESAAEYHRFLKEAHYTARDVNERVEIQILSTRIQERILAGIHGRVAERKAWAAFVTEYAETWRARTVCAPEYLLVRCSNGPAP